MRVAGHRRGRFFSTQSRQHLGQAAHKIESLLRGSLEPEPEVSGDLIVARTTGVQLAGKIADHDVKTRLDEGMNVLGTAGVHGHTLLADFSQCINDGC